MFSSQRGVCFGGRGFWNTKTARLACFFFCFFFLWRYTALVFLNTSDIEGLLLAVGTVLLFGPS